MGRRLPPGEAERRAKERARRTWSGENYRHYDTSKGFGGPEEWERIAEELFGAKHHQSTYKAPPNQGFADKFLQALGLESLPRTLNELRAAFRKAMFKAHPDTGGSDEAARAVLEAFAILKRRIAA